MAVGAKTKIERPETLAVEARSIALRMPDLLLDARKIANNVVMGWHGRRKRGNGENFWQFRPYVEGEPVARIDWRRSARDDHTYLRDQEWDAAQTVWLWTDRTASMSYSSRFAVMPKADRAILLSLTLAELFARVGERVGMPGSMAPTTSRHASERMALALMNDNISKTLPDVSDVSRFSHIIVISDFLDDPERIKTQLAELAKRQVTAHFIEVCDPAEERFPFSGRTEFIDPESGQKFLAGRAQQYHDAYRKIYYARRTDLVDFARRHGWSYHISATDQPITAPLLALANVMGSTVGYRSL